MNMATTGRAVLSDFWNKLASHFGRSHFHPCSASCAAQSLLRLEPSLDILVQEFMRTVLVSTLRVAFGASRFAPGETVAAPVPLLTPLRWMVQGCPSLDNPFGGVKVHWTFTTSRLTHSPARLKRATDQSALPE